MVRRVVLHIVSSTRPGLVWRTPKEFYNPEFQFPIVKHGGRSVMIWAAVCWYHAGHIIVPNGRVAASDCVDVSDNQVHPMVQKVNPNNDTIFQEHNSPVHTARSVQSWFEKHKNGLQQLPSPAHSPDQNTIEGLWSLFQSRLRSRSFLPSSLFKQAEFPHEDWYNIPLEYSELLRVYSRENTSRTAGKWWPNSELIKNMYLSQLFSFFSIPYISLASNLFMAKGHT